MNGELTTGIASSMMRLCSGPHFMPVLALILLHPFTDTDACDAESNGISRGKLAALAKLATSRSATNGDERNSMSRHEPQLISTPTGVAWVSGGQTIGAKPIPEVLTGATTLIVVPSDHAGPAAHGLDNVALGSMFVMLGALMLSRRATRSDYSLVRRASDYSWPHPARILLARILPADVPSHAHYGTRPAAGTHAHLSRHRCDRIFAVCTCVCLCASCSSGFRQ